MSIYNYFMRNLMIQRKKPKNEQIIKRIKMEDNKNLYFFEVTYQLVMTLDFIFILIQIFNIVKIKIDRYI